MRVLVVGGRNFHNTKTFKETLDQLHQQHSITCIIHDGKSSVAHFGHYWARGFGIEEMPFDRDWGGTGRSSGGRRNRTMLEEGRPDLVVAFSGGKDTADLVRRAKLINIPVHIGEDSHVAISTTSSGNRPGA